MSKLVSITDKVAAQLDKMKDEHEGKYDETLSYSKAIKKLLTETGRWPKQSKKKKLK